MECQDKFAQFLLRWNNLVLFHISNFLVIDDILEGLIQLLLCLFHIHHLLHGVIRLLFELFRLFCQELFVAFEVI